MTLDCDTLRRAGQLLLGPEWQRALARVLGPHHPDGPRESLDPRLVQRWAAQERPVPVWVGPVLGALLSEEAVRADARIVEMRSLAERLQKGLGDDRC